MKPPILSEVVEKGLCIGCGMCAALCPSKALKIGWNEYGEYNPIEVKTCTLGCELCINVCPFSNRGEDEDAIGRDLYGNISGIKHCPETGHYLESYVGYSASNRPTSASGGIATWILETLLIENIIDRVVCVTPFKGLGNLFSFRVLDTQEEVRKGAGSVYYPVEMSAVIEQILEMPGRYAITGVPCFIKAIRLAQQRNAKLRERIVVTVGLVCGQMKSSHFTSYISSLSGAKGVERICYRGKDADHPVNNYHYAITDSERNIRKVYWDEGISEAWVNRWFTPTACNYCDDVFAECADVTCLDAWLPEYSRDSKGTSLILVRLPMISDLIEHARGIDLEPISIEEVIKSQAGVLAIKREHLAYRLYLDRKENRKSIEKRVAPKNPKNPFLSQDVVLREQMRDISRENWNTNNPDIERFSNMMQPVLKQLMMWRLISRMITLPLRIMRRLRE